ncbi:hypothetical protein BDV96DRAFT_596339 [Lophiotrema nucula]|uniref:Uncharacterized protein n=1 Tax=Lophiotrema nucula TaxID=690887 RepID=A0A6A5ZJA2_9PLEO|nr:hypothetical protein BDV96DRAFT_596339 [Lophiotrema nucula]
MVKVLENRVVDLDLLPGTKDQQEAAAAAQQTITEALPEGSAQNQTPAKNATNAGKAVGAAVGGSVKGVVDTAGNTVGTLGEGLAGTVGGLGKGVGSAAVYGGTALDGVGRSIGSGLGFGGTKGKQTEQVKTEVEATKSKQDDSKRLGHEENGGALDDIEKTESIQLNAGEDEK